MSRQLLRSTGWGLGFLAVMSTVVVTSDVSAQTTTGVPIVVPYQAYYRPVLPGYYYYADPGVASGGPYYVQPYPNPYSFGSAYYYSYPQPGGYRYPSTYYPYQRPYIYPY